MSERFVYRDSFGVRRTIHFERDNRDTFTVETEQDLEPVLDSVARDRELMAHTGPNKVVARLPMIFAERFLTPDGWDEEALRAWLNSAEAEPFRVWRGRV